MRAFNRHDRVGLALLIFCAMSLRESWAKSPKDASVDQKPKYSLSSFAKYVEMAGATRVGKDVCVLCHAPLSSNFRHAFHAQQGVECEDCHGAGSLHVDGSGDVAKIISFRARPARDANGVCLSCHVQDERRRNWLAGRHAAENVRCIDCHQVHAQAAPAATASKVNFDTASPGHATFVERFVPESGVLLSRRSVTNDACLKCHPTERAQTNLPYHHPLREAKMACVDCHDPHGGAVGNNLRMANVNQLCLSCHAQYRGPYMYQHPPVTENCLICHTPHGSANTNLLTVSMPALCLQCHTGHHDGAGLPLTDRCTNCHGSIHGSDVATPTGGTRFVDKGGLGVPGFPQPTLTGSSNSHFGRMALEPVAAHAAMLPGSRVSPGRMVSSQASALGARWVSPVAAHSSMLGALSAPFSGGLSAMMGAFPGELSAGGALPGAEAATPDNDWGLYFTPGAYRFTHVTGYGGRVGGYDSLQESEEGDFEGDYVSVPHRLSLLTRGTVLTGSDFDIATQLNVGETLEMRTDLRSFVQQQDNYPFYAGVISPDIGTSIDIPAGSVFGVKRRMGNAYARVKLPSLPVHLFVKGGWQARVGHTQLAYLDENIDTTCSTCHFTSRLQSVNYTTRDLGGGVEVKAGGVNLTYEHDYSSFNDRLPYPSALFGPMLPEVEPGPVPVPDTPAGTYYLDIPAASVYSADALKLNWTASPKLIFNGDATYRRARDVFTGNPQNGFDSNTTLVWHPYERLHATADYRQQDLVNGFVPYFAFFGNVSYHKHWAGLKLNYDLTKHLELETHYQRMGITRSNAFLWPQIYSFDNTDLRYVIPSSFGNTGGLTLRYHPGHYWNARAGYEFTGTHAPGFLIDPGSNNRIFGDITLLPARWLSFTNTSSIIIQNAFPTIARRNRFYVESADATLAPLPNLNLDFGYSYQQNNLSTYMAFQNDSTAGYVVDEPFVPYRQLSQTYWVRSDYKFRKRLGLDLALSHNSAHSGMRPDVNPGDYLLLGNGPLVQQGSFDPVLFQQALDALTIGATQVSQVNVPQLIGQGKLYYLLPRGFDAGFLCSYSSYRDFMNPDLDGILRSYTIYFGRSW